MSPERRRAAYVDSSAIVKLVVREPESAALRKFLTRRSPLVTSALARTEVTRALLGFGGQAVRRGHEALSRFELVRVSDRVLSAAGLLQPPDVRSLDAIHLATAEQLEDDLGIVVTYDERMAAVAASRGWRVAAPA